MSGTKVNSRRGRPRPRPEPRYIGVGPPWVGYAPDLNPSITSFEAFEDCQGLVSQDGQLTLDMGWLRLEDNVVHTLPLGGYLDAGGDHSWTEAEPGYEQPVVLLAELSRSDIDGIGKLSVFAVTGLSLVAIPFGNPPNGTATIGFCWWLNPSNLQWTEVPWNPAGGGTQPVGTRDNVYDWAYYARSGTTISNNTIPGVIYFTNYADEVYVWDIGDVAIGPGPPGAYQSAFGLPWGNQSFYARSVDTFVDRLVFLNTREESTAPGNPLVRETKRVRWTDLGSPPSLTAAGSGFIDFNEFKGDGYRVLSFQDIVACYFQDGVGVLRRTNTANNPFGREYWSKERGLLGTFAVTRIDRDLHFGVFTDGWFFLSSSGQWTEAGTVGTQFGLMRKWTRKFFSLLDSENLHKVVVNYNKYMNRINVTFPLAGGGDTTWVYDMKTDTVWPDDPYTVVCWGEARAVWGQAVSWIPGMSGMTWAEVEGAWQDYGIHYGERSTLHGSEYGLVLLHTPTMTTRDGDVVEWFLRSHLQFLEDVGGEKAGDEIVLEHGVLNTSSVIAVGFGNDNGELASQGVELATGSGGWRSATSVHPMLANALAINGYALSVRISGTGAVRLWSWKIGLRPTEVPLKEVG